MKNDFVKTISLILPALRNNTADADRLIAALKQDLDTDSVSIDLALLRQLPDILRKNNYRVRCILFKDRKGWLLVNIADESKPIAS